MGRFDADTQRFTHDELAGLMLQRLLEDDREARRLVKVGGKVKGRERKCDWGVKERKGSLVKVGGE